MRHDCYADYKSYSYEKAVELLVVPAVKRSKELRELIEESDDETKVLLRDILKYVEMAPAHCKEMYESGVYVDDWMCDQDGYYIHLDRYHHDRAEVCRTEILDMEEMKEREDCTDDIRKNIDEAIIKNQRLISWNKNRIFHFKLKMGHKKMLNKNK